MLTKGQTYKHHSNGCTYLCLEEGCWTGGNPTLMDMSGHHWTFEAHDVNVYEDGTIDWWYSTGGRFASNNF